MTKDFNNITACQKLNIKEQVEKTYMSYNFKSVTPDNLLNITK